MITEELIARFFKKECTADEAERVAAWLQANPEIADNYLDKEAYNSFQQNENLSKETKEKAWRFIRKSIAQQKRVHWLKQSAVVACVAGCIALSLLLFTKNKSNPAIITSYKKEAKTNVPLADTEYNFTRSIRRIALADGSIISLSPQSFVWFVAPFGKTQRNVNLHGEARFEVTKNKQKPFTVYAGAFATTALGTEFIVKQKSDGIYIQLKHGKVVIKAQ
ncbi:MAG: FecR family protein, partial [Bacteroidota bacterium]|nr:FecR family protein [Bacteroidota bacterium]